MDEFQNCPLLTRPSRQAEIFQGTENSVDAISNKQLVAVLLLEKSVRHRVIEKMDQMTIIVLNVQDSARFRMDPVVATLSFPPTLLGCHNRPEAQQNHPIAVPSWLCARA